MVEVTACNPFSFDAGRCAMGALDGFVLWLADWYFSLPTLAVVALAVILGGVAYRQGGWPAVVAWAVGFGFLWGRKGTRGVSPEPFEHIDPRSPDAAPSKPRKPGQKYETDARGLPREIKH